MSDKKVKYVRRRIKWGNLLVAVNIKGEITGVWFENQKYYPRVSIDEVIDASDEGSLEEPIRKVLRQFDKEIAEYASGQRFDFTLPLNPEGTPFRKKVWSILQSIPWGETTTYGEISQKVAASMGKKTMSAQAVGGAVGHNPISILIPCHRVIGKDGSLTGYAGGLERKEALLKHEGKI